MDSIFLVKLALSFVVGGVWLTLVTVIAEKFGTKLGGVIGGLPTTIVMALFFIGWTQTPLIASQATTVIPIVMGINSVFIAVYVLLSRFNFYLSVAVSLIVWFLLALALVLLEFDNFVYSLIGLAVLLLSCYYVLKKWGPDIEAEGERKTQYTGYQLLLRGILSGAIIAFAVIIAKVGGPLLGGIFAVFPAVMLSVMIITYLAQGKSFSRQTMKVLMVSGAINVSLYGILVRYAYLFVDLVTGTLIAFAISLISTYCVYLFLGKVKI